ncbi:MAG: protein translocase subunit SecD [Propionibacteriaceae bacterium]|jgi:preprotein translocase subunit SecD|nr:protein translocase subunit SecD [Propionibacteriaceae bacterium]
MATTSRHRPHPLRTLITFGAFILALYVIMAATGSWAPKLGLDLRGGTTITLTATNITGEGSINQDNLEVARNIIDQRVNGYGVTEAEVTTSGDRQIIVAAPNVQRDDLARLVGQTAQLYFRKVYAVQQNGDTTNPGTATVPEESIIPDDGTIPEEVVIPGEETPTPDESPAVEPTATETPKAKSGPPLLPELPTPIPSPRPTAPGPVQQTTDELLKWTPAERDYSDFAAFVCGDSFPNVTDQPYIACDGDAQTSYYKYLLGPALISGQDLESANAAIPQNSVSWLVQLKFNDVGGTAFTAVTTALSAMTEPQNQFGIVLDDKVISAPRVNEPISGGSAVIEGSFDQKSSTELANVLKYGALPLTFETSNIDDVSAKLGGDQLSAGIAAGLIGLALVVLYCIIYYRGLATVVVASLGIAGLLTYAFIVILGIGMGYALNLPGIAGAIVAIGITADSFIIYFERIRDEAREGRSLRTSIESGWIRSRKTILVADSVSLLSAVVLWILAVGSVRGFAFTLGLTTLIDIAIVFFFTKPLMSLLGKTKFFGEGRRFSGFEAEHLGMKVTALPAAAASGGSH